MVWCDERKDKRLDQIQIEICKYVLETPKGLVGFSTVEAEQFVKDLREQMNELEMTMQPVVFGSFSHSAPAKYGYIPLHLFSEERMKFNLEYYGPQLKAGSKFN